VRQLNHLLNRTVTYSRLQAFHRSSNEHSFQIARIQNRVPVPLELARGHAPYVGQEVWFVEDQSDPTILSYRYVYGPDPTSEGGWICRYEYSTTNPRGYQYDRAHLHVNVSELGGRVAGKVFKKLHFPTGFVRLEQVLLHLIVEWDVPVLEDALRPDARDEALAVLRERLANSPRSAVEP